MADANLTRVTDRYADAVWRKDVEGLLALYAPEFRGFDLWGDWVQDAGALRRSVESWFGGLAADEKVKIGISDMRVTEGADLALIWR